MIFVFSIDRSLKAHSGSDIYRTSNFLYAATLVTLVLLGLSANLLTLTRVRIQAKSALVPKMEGTFLELIMMYLRKANARASRSICVCHPFR